jgi:acyl-CoA reductase-like NAD-dependent aldehyde dehydrogenase
MSDTLNPFIAGRQVPNPEGAAGDLLSPIDGLPYARIVESSPSLVEDAVADARAAWRRHRATPLHQRLQWLQAAAQAIEAAADELVALIIHDIGKPRRAASFEVQRSAQFFRACAATAASLGGETLPVDAVAQGAGRLGFTMRVPYGVVAAITPFNAPINLLSQKLAPALAAGNAVVVKPHPAGTRVALRLAALLAAAGLPPGLFNVLPGHRDAALALVSHPDVAAITFTGGTAAGDALARAAGARKFVAELGSNAANIVLADADLADAASRIASAAFEASGQQCVSAQRIIVDALVLDRFLGHFVTAARALRVGDPHDPATDIGPMVSLEAAERVMRMASESAAAGGHVALAPIRRDCLVSPGILVGSPTTSSIWRDEVFGPLAVVVPADGPQQALDLANDSPFGLQGALFTRDLAWTMRFARDFEVGALWVNEASRFRLDMYPFGGVKRSGTGREGVRYAIEELSQLKFIGLRTDLS